ncbi:hypothetical protein BDW22DRAFT_806484 [Trametopsis cervina]|nr:hypothetical protein BDW22DRAFT_806484 [Trametopsis cervina]
MGVRKMLISPSVDEHPLCLHTACTAHLYADGWHNLRAFTTATPSHISTVLCDAQFVAAQWSLIRVWTAYRLRCDRSGSRRGPDPIKSTALYFWEDLCKYTTDNCKSHNQGPLGAGEARNILSRRTCLLDLTGDLVRTGNCIPEIHLGSQKACTVPRLSHHFYWHG